MAAQPDIAAAKDSRHRIIGGLTLVLLAIAAAIGLSTLNRVTSARVERNAQAWILERLDVLIPLDQRNNDIITDRVIANSPDLLGTSRPVTVFRARQSGQPVAVVLHTIAPDGYRGPIELLVGIDTDGQLLGVQVVRHRETPGLGDAFENRNKDWLPKFNGRSLTDPPQQRWAVRADGGDFDGFTGATITPRAIVKAVRRSLEFYHARQDTLFTAPNGAEVR